MNYKPSSRKEINKMNFYVGKKYFHAKYGMVKIHAVNDAGVTIEYPEKVKRYSGYVHHLLTLDTAQKELKPIESEW